MTQLDSVIGRWAVPDKTVMGSSVVIFQWEVVLECNRPRKLMELEEVLEGLSQYLCEEMDRLELDMKEVANMFSPRGLSKLQVVQP